jgi:hypothetical protein
VHAHIHPDPHGLPEDRPEVPLTATHWAQRPMAVPTSEHSLPREPLRPRVGVAAARHETATRVAGHYPSFLVTGSCARPQSSHGLGFTLVPGVFASCCAAPAERRPFPALSPRILPQVPGPLPGRPGAALARFFTPGIGLPPFLTRSAQHKIPHNDFRAGLGFRGCSHSLMFRPPALLATQVIPTAKAGRSTHLGQP